MVIQKKLKPFCLFCLCLGVTGVAFTSSCFSFPWMSDLSLSSFFECCIISLFLSFDVISSLSISHHHLFLRVRSLSSLFDHAYISVSWWVIRREERITLVRVCVRACVRACVCVCVCGFFLRIKDETRRALPLILGKGERSEKHL